jgi:glyoxylase I family protein
MSENTIICIHHVSLIVADTQRALGFYHALLGLPLAPDRPDLGYPGAWLIVAPGQQIHLLEVPNPDPTRGRPAHGGKDRHIAFLVRDFDRVRLGLQTAKIDYTLSRSGRQALFCRDPDGNAIEIIGE